MTRVFALSRQLLARLRRANDLMYCVGNALRAFPTQYIRRAPQARAGWRADRLLNDSEILPAQRKSLRFRHGDEGGVPFWSGAVGYRSDRPTPERCRVLASPVRPSECLPVRNAR